MIGLPTLPIDNLHKFHAVTGLVLVVTAAVLMVQLEIVTNENICRAAEKSGTRIDALFQEIGNVSKGRVLDDPGWKAVENSMRDFEYYVSFETARCRKWQNGLFYLGIYGAFHSSMGFWQWHRKAQVLHDGVLKSQLAQERLKQAMAEIDFAKAKIDLVRQIDSLSLPPETVRELVPSNVKLPSLSKSAPCSPPADQSSSDEAGPLSQKKDPL